MNQIRYSYGEKVEGHYTEGLTYCTVEAREQEDGLKVHISGKDVEEGEDIDIESTLEHGYDGRESAVYSDQEPDKPQNVEDLKWLTELMLREEELGGQFMEGNELSSWSYWNC